MTRSSPKSPPLTRKSPTALFNFDKPVTSPKSPENRHGKKSPKEEVSRGRPPPQAANEDDEFANMVSFFLSFLSVLSFSCC